MSLAPLPVVVPLLVAALLSGISSLVPRRVFDLVSGITAAGVLGICIHLASSSRSSPIVYWFGGWHPQSHYPIGISFVIEPMGAGMASLVALLVLAAFIFSWNYFESIKSLYHAVMLIFLAAMCGLCLTGDLFNLFVWLELMSAAGIMLCGYKAEEYGPLQGALNFAVTNTVGAFLSLSGIGLLYAQTGALNLAEIGRTLQAHNPGGWLISIVFLFIASGFLVKAAVFPFHFWLGDAHAVAPTPVCVLFSGVMVELGLYAIARIFWTIFAGPMANHTSVRTVFLLAGALTAAIGASECFGQRHLKRLLAFSTISHMGIMVLGFALLSPGALAGTALYVLGHGLVKASLFLCVGIVLHHQQTVDEYELRARGRAFPGVGVLICLGALGLAALPPFANFSGESLIEGAADKMGMGWVSVFVILTGAVTAGAVLRVAGRVFLGWGEQGPVARGSPRIPMKRETDKSTKATPATMWLPPAFLLLLALGLGVYQPLHRAVQRYGIEFQQTERYAAVVLDGAKLSQPIATAAEPSGASWHPVITIGLAAGLALAALFPRRLVKVTPRKAGAVLARGMLALRSIQSGRVGDYVAWFALGLAIYCSILVSLR